MYESVHLGRDEQASTTVGFASNKRQKQVVKVISLHKLVGRSRRHFLGLYQWTCFLSFMPTVRLYLSPGQGCPAWSSFLQWFSAKEILLPRGCLSVVI